MTGGVRDTPRSTTALLGLKVSLFLSTCPSLFIHTQTQTHAHTPTDTHTNTCTHTHAHTYLQDSATRASTSQVCTAHIHTRTHIHKPFDVFLKLKTHLLWLLLPGFSPLDDGQQVLILREGFLLAGGGMFCPALWTCQGAAPSQQLDQTLLTEGVGAGQDPRYQVSIVLEIL